MTREYSRRTSVQGGGRTSILGLPLTCCEGKVGGDVKNSLGSGGGNPASESKISFSVPLCRSRQ